MHVILFWAFVLVILPLGVAWLLGERKRRQGPPSGPDR